ncbi:MULTISPECIES: gamma carbonic anhydrase family protein [unclassified Moraxella]|uniref:gamma carbonic anhydrase family protein n=1 Tax=unclassified Moraxella TaxID=2685852 RepID=UPI003AF53958
MLYQWNDKQPQYKAPFTGWVADSAEVIGDVVLGDNVSVWFGAVIRADNAPVSLGDDTNIQENSVIHTDVGIPVTIGKGVTVGHLAMLHGCTIGDNSLIGIGAVVLNNAVIGKNCIVGANALVTENMQIPDNSLVIGSPAKVVKTLSEQQIEMLKLSAKSYVAKAQSFKHSLKAVDFIA